MLITLSKGMKMGAVPPRPPVPERIKSILREVIRETNASIEHCATTFAATPRIDREPLPSEMEVLT